MADSKLVDLTEISQLSDSDLLYISSSGTSTKITGLNIKESIFSDVEKVKLSNIEDNATADQTKAEIDLLGINASSTNGFTLGKNVPSSAVFTDTITIINDSLTSTSVIEALSANQGKVLKDSKVDKVVGFGLSSNDFNDVLLTKLNSIEDSATADQSDAEIKIAYENNANTNAFTDTEKTVVSVVTNPATSTQDGYMTKEYASQLDSLAETPATTPIITGINTQVEFGEVVITVTNPDVNATYTYYTSLGSTVVDNGNNTYTVTLQDYSVGSLDTFSIYASVAGQSNSAIANHDITVTNTVLATPTLSGVTSGTTLTDVSVSVSNYDATQTYTSSVNLGTLVDNGGGVYTITLPSYPSDDVVLSVTASKVGDVDSDTATHSIAVVDVTIVTDVAIQVTDIFNDLTTNDLYTEVL